ELGVDARVGRLVDAIEPRIGGIHLLRQPAQPLAYRTHQPLPARFVGAFPLVELPTNALLQGCDAAELAQRPRGVPLLRLRLQGPQASRRSLELTLGRILFQLSVVVFHASLPAATLCIARASYFLSSSVTSWISSGERPRKRGGGMRRKTSSGRLRR